MNEKKENNQAKGKFFIQTMWCSHTHTRSDSNKKDDA